MLSALILCLLIAAAAYTLLQSTLREPLRLPPGPRGVPLLGNALQIPKAHSWLTFTRWAQTYGDVMHLSILGRSFIILSSREAIVELLERRGAIYSDRPVLPMAGELAGHAQYTGMLPYGPRHKEGRKLILSMINPRKASSLQAIQEAKMASFVSKLTENPSDFLLHIRWLVASIALQLTYGLTVDNYNDPVVQAVEQIMGDFSKISSPGAYLVDSLPFLMHVPDWFPGADFKKVAKAARDTLLSRESELYELVKEQVARGTALPSFIADLIQSNPSPTPEEEGMWKNVGVHIYAAGSDATVSVIESFLVLIAQNQDIQHKAQAEVDGCTGRTRPPRFGDRNSLPYLEAVLLEVLRHNPAGPLALPHKVRQDDHYAGYRIPAGATVLPNTWVIMRDPVLYPNPGKVDPERYLHRSDATINPDPRSFAFGYGRRLCPGQMLGEDILFLAAANILAFFDVSDAFALDGSAPEWDGGTISHPAPFICTIRPRLSLGTLPVPGN